MKITITNTPSVKDYVSKKNGKPYKKIYLKAQEYGADVISGFYRAEMANWKKGDVVDVERVSEGSVSKDGQTTFRDFKMPERQGAVNTKEIEKKLEQVLNYLVGLKIEIAIIKENVAPKKPHAPVDYPTAESEGIDTDNVFPEPTDEELHDIFKEEDDAR